MQTKLVIALLYAASAIPFCAGAQPVDAVKTPFVGFEYQSAFSNYKPFDEQKLRPWRELNDGVAKAGGHIGIFGGANHGEHGARNVPALKLEPPGPPLRGAPKAPAGKPHH